MKFWKHKNLTDSMLITDNDLSWYRRVWEPSHRRHIMCPDDYKQLMNSEWYEISEEDAFLEMV